MGLYAESDEHWTEQQQILHHTIVEISWRYLQCVDPMGPCCKLLYYSHFDLRVFDMVIYGRLNYVGRCYVIAKNLVKNLPTYLYTCAFEKQYNIYHYCSSFILADGLL